MEIGIIAPDEPPKIDPTAKKKKKNWSALSANVAQAGAVEALSNDVKQVAREQKQKQYLNMPVAPEAQKLGQSSLKAPCITIMAAQRLSQQGMVPDMAEAPSVPWSVTVSAGLSPGSAGEDSATMSEIGWAPAGSNVSNVSFAAANSATPGAVGDRAVSQLRNVKRQGRLRLLRLRLPTMSISAAMGCVGFSGMALDIQFSTLVLVWALFVYLLAHLPSDYCLVRATIGLSVPLAFCLSAGQVLRVLSEQRIGHAMCMIFYAAVNICAGIWACIAPFRISSTRQLLRECWVIYGVQNLLFGFGNIANFLLTLLTTDDPPSHLVLEASRALSHFTCAFLCLHAGLVERVRSWLMLRGEEGAAAAGVAELLVGWSPDKVLAAAREGFVYVSGDKLFQKDMADNKPNPELYRLTDRGFLGKVDAFLSHSWHDSEDLKWASLQEWRKEFKTKNGGREPKLWIDKYCIDQNNINQSLACLPVYLAGCKKLVVLCGKTYLERLWCLVEIMVFLEMGGQMTDLEVKLLDAKHSVNKRSSLQVLLEDFDPSKARCFNDDDTERLRTVINITGYDRIAKLVHDVFDGASSPPKDKPGGTRLGKVGALAGKAATRLYIGVKPAVGISRRTFKADAPLARVLDTE